MSILLTCTHNFQQLTISTNIKVQDAANAHIDHAQEALVLLLELLLVKDLNCKDAFIRRTPVISISILLRDPGCSNRGTYMSKLSFQ